MKHTTPLLLAAASGILFTVTGQAAITTELQSGLMWFWDFEAGTAPMSYTGAGNWSGSFTGSLVDGKNCGTGAPYISNPGLTGNAFTVSFDIKLSAGTAAWTDVFAMNSGGSLKDANSLRFEYTDKNRLEVYTSNFAGVTGSPGISNVTATGIAGNWMNYTLTSDGATLALYENGVWKGSTAAAFTGAITGIQFQQEFGGGRVSGAQTYDNIGIWNRALSAGEVTTLVAVPEPSTYALAVVGVALGGAVLARRRKKVG